MASFIQVPGILPRRTLGKKRNKEIQEIVPTLLHNIFKELQLSST